VAGLVRALLLKYLYDLSLRELETRLYTDLLARWFAGYGLFDALPDHVTMQRFESWVCQNCKRVFFDEILRQIDADYPDDKLQIQIGDTYAMHANASREDLIPLLRHSSEQVLRLAVRTVPVRMEIALRQFAWNDLFGQYKEPSHFNLTAKERAARQATVVLAALDLHMRMVEALRDRPIHELPELRQWLARLKKIIDDNFIFEAESVRELPAKEKGDFRIGSASDPEASYRVHGSRAEQTSLGYNIQFAITPVALSAKRRLILALSRIKLA
jgi:IS5 family transposase